MQYDINKKIGQATKWSSVTEICAKLVTPITNAVLARLLLPEAFGVVATITMVISFAEVFTDAGFQKYIVQHEFDSEEELDKSTDVAFWTNFVLSLLICAAIFLFRDPIAALVGNPELGGSISIASLLILIAAFSSIQAARFRRDFDFKTLFFVRIGSSLMPLIVTIPLALIFRNYWALLIGTMASQLFSAVVLTIKSKWRPKFYYSFRRLREMFSFTGWTLLGSITVWLTSYVDVFIVGSILSEHYVGLYKTGMATVNSYMAIITSAIAPVLYSALSRYQSEESLFRKTYYSFQRLTAIFVVPMGIGVFLFSDLVTQILLGNQWMEISNFIGMWGMSSTITITFSYFGGEVYRSKGKPHFSVISQASHLAFIVPALIISAKFGFEALCITRAAVRLQGTLVGLIIMSAAFKLRIKDAFSNTWPMIFSAGIMGVFGYFSQNIFDDFLWQFFTVFLCVIVYFGALFLIFPRVRKDVLGSEEAQKLFGRFRKGEI